MSMLSDLQAKFFKHTLVFKQASGTSRGILKTKDSWFIHVWEKDKPELVGIGECGLLKGLSIDDRPGYEEKLQEVVKNIEEYRSYLDLRLKEFPSIRFGLEMAIRDLVNGGEKILFASPFTEGKKEIPINGLIWMGSSEFMQEQIEEKIEAGFNCVKLKIGAIDFEAEMKLLEGIRARFSEAEIELRVDANGAFTSENALDKLKRLADLAIHSIEQPIRQGQWKEMTDLCKVSPLPIALDEELIGVHDRATRQQLLETIQPQFIILKPSLLGGFAESEEWIELANGLGIGWWITSALESNIGLNAIAQWTYTLHSPLPQGLGTGLLYTNNFESPLYIERGLLTYNPERNWEYIP